MPTWARFLKLLATDGVSLCDAEHDAITEDGGRLTTQLLVRQVGPRFLSVEVTIESTDDPVLMYDQRRIVRLLELAPNKYMRNDW